MLSSDFSLIHTIITNAQSINSQLINIQWEVMWCSGLNSYQKIHSIYTPQRKQI